MVGIGALFGREGDGERGREARSAVMIVASFAVQRFGLDWDKELLVRAAAAEAGRQGWKAKRDAALSPLWRLSPFPLTQKSG